MQKGLDNLRFTEDGIVDTSSAPGNTLEAGGGSTFLRTGFETVSVLRSLVCFLLYANPVAMQ